jgi:hypothetical protein
MRIPRVSQLLLTIICFSCYLGKIYNRYQDLLELIKNAYSYIHTHIYISRPKLQIKFLRIDMQ